MFSTEHDFTLPMGYIDEDGGLHRQGTMRLATAADEILPLRDPRVQKNSAYLVVILLSRVIVALEGVEPVTPQVVENLFAADLDYLQQLYNRINQLEDDSRSMTCPNCRESFEVGANPFEGSLATPLSS